jgi:diaminohydroxyphosphoribosylaminopyrimidine deaminase/5-amino-6-(5-phosphoribosylamino)uracil reductase
VFVIDKDIERSFMQLAIEESKKSEGQVKVGAVIVVDGEVVATGFKKSGIHAERMAIDSAVLKKINFKKAIMYTTLEPCVDTGGNQKLKCCADLIVENRIASVFIGRYDPNPNINRKGWLRLRDGGVLLRDFPQDLRLNIDDVNNQFMSYFSSGVGPSGGAKIAHKERADFSVQFSKDDLRSMNVGWSLCGVNAAYACATLPVKVAIARFASEFQDIDDPTAYEYSHSVRIGVGEVGIFLGSDACVLVRPREIQSGPNYGDKDYFVKFDFLVRLKDW